MKQYTFKDGTKVIANSVEEAKSKHKVVAVEGNPYRNILKELGFKQVAWFYYIDLTKYRFEMPAGTRKYTLSIGVSIEEKFSRVFVYKRSVEEEGDILSTFVKNDKDFKKNVQKLIVKATKIASLFEKWCDK